jgi:UDP-N-acetylglucosamine 2-epimerase/N-acetylmannosamine kinase
VRFFKNMEPEDFLKLLINSQCLIGNSSVGIRECAYLGVPVVNIGTRQHRRLRGDNVIDIDYDKDAIVKAVQKHIKSVKIDASSIYGNGDSGNQIANLLATIDLPFHKTITY